MTLLTAGLPSEHFVMAWKSVDFPTLARPTWSLVSCGSGEQDTLRSKALHTIPLFRLFPGRPRGMRTGASCFFGGIFFFLLAKQRVVWKLVGFDSVDQYIPRRAVESAGPAAELTQEKLEENKTSRGTSTEVVFEIVMRDAAVTCRIPADVYGGNGRW